MKYVVHALPVNMIIRFHLRYLKHMLLYAEIGYVLLRSSTRPCIHFPFTSGTKNTDIILSSNTMKDSSSHALLSFCLMFTVEPVFKATFM